MPTIKIPFPLHEGLEVKNATIDLENGYTVVEYGEKEIGVIKKDILVPDSIGIYETSDGVGTLHKNGDGLYISFNDDKQLLCFSKESFGVFPMNSDYYGKVKCKLIPCKRKYLKAGDTAFWTYESEIKLDDLVDIASYCKIINEKDAIYIEHNLTCICTDDKDIFWCKVEPIQ